MLRFNSSNTDNTLSCRFAKDIDHVQICENIYSIFSSNSEANASENIENEKGVFNV